MERIFPIVEWDGWHFAAVLIYESKLQGRNLNYYYRNLDDVLDRLREEEV